MYRGSSPLLWKDYLIHREVIKKLKEKKYLRKANLNQKNIDDIVELGHWIRSYYNKKITKVNGLEKLFNPSNILVTKILLGTLGCVPAFDRYFIKGMGKNKIKPKEFNSKSLNDIYNFYKKHEKEFVKAQKDIKKNKWIKIPINEVSRYVFMAGWI